MNRQELIESRASIIMARIAIGRLARELGKALETMVNQASKARIAYGLNELAEALDYMARQERFHGAFVYSASEASHIVITTALELELGFESQRFAFFAGNRKPALAPITSKSELAIMAREVKNAKAIRLASESASKSLPALKSANNASESFHGFHDKLSSMLDYRERALASMKRELAKSEPALARELEQERLAQIPIFEPMARSRFSYFEYRERALHEMKAILAKNEQESASKLDYANKLAEFKRWYKANNLSHADWKQEFDALKKRQQERIDSEYTKRLIAFRRSQARFNSLYYKDTLTRWLANGKGTIGFRALNNAYEDHITGVKHGALRKAQGKDIRLRFNELILPASEPAPIEFSKVCYELTSERQITAKPKLDGVKLWDELTESFIDAKQVASERELTYKALIKSFWLMASEPVDSASAGIGSFTCQQIDMFSLYGNTHIRTYQKQALALLSDIHFEKRPKDIPAPMAYGICSRWQAPKAMLKRLANGKFASAKKAPKAKASEPKALAI